jgi:xanthine dehydrogenase small subunit
MDGRELVSVEGVADADGRLHPVQQAMIREGGSQCGYCTPGFVMSLFCEYYRPGRSGYDAEAIAGNLCRCTGYRPILDAARSLPLPRPDDPRLEPLSAALPRLSAVDYRHAARRFLRPDNLAELLRCIAEEPAAKLIAGGTDLMVYANQRYERWETLISLEGVEELHGVRVRANEVTLGAALSLTDVERILSQERSAQLPMLEQLLPLFSSRLIRNRATLGGNLATGSPIGDFLPALLALDAEVSLASAGGERRVPLREFFIGYRKTALEPGELISSVHVALPQPRLQRFYKVSKRVLDDISTVAAAFALDLDRAGRVTCLRAAFGGVAATPLRAYSLEEAALGRPWNEGTLDSLVEASAALGTPLSDHRGSAGYRKAMLGKLLEKFFAETRKEARQGMQAETLP